MSIQRADTFDFSEALQLGESKRKHVYVEHFSNQESRGPDRFGWAIRDDRYKLVAVDDQDLMLFDLKEDPYEMNNLLTSNIPSFTKKKVEELQRAYQKIKQ